MTCSHISASHDDGAGNICAGIGEARGDDAVCHRRECPLTITTPRTIYVFNLMIGTGALVPYQAPSRTPATVSVRAHRVVD